MLETDGLRYELRCSVLRGTAATVIIAISSYHHHRQIWTALFDLRQQLQAIHAHMLISARTANNSSWYAFPEAETASVRFYLNERILSGHENGSYGGAGTEAAKKARTPPESPTRGRPRLWYWKHPAYRSPE